AGRRGGDAALEPRPERVQPLLRDGRMRQQQHQTGEGRSHAGPIYLLDSPSVSEFVFGTHNAAFVQVMYEQYLRDPTSVPEEWRQLFDNGKLAELPVIPTTKAEVTETGMRDAGGVPTATPPHPASPIPSPGLSPIT